MKTILVVEDDAALLNVLLQALTLHGYHAVGAGDGVEALALCGSLQPPVVVTDINMPSMGGIELLDELAQSATPPKVIAMSGGGFIARDEVLDDAEMLGAFAVLAKPFSVEMLCDLVDSALEEQAEEGLG